jgi:hypothetical protein
MQCFCHGYSDFFILWFSCSITSTKGRLIIKCSHFRLTSRDLVHWLVRIRFAFLDHWFDWAFYFRRVQPGQSSAPKIDVHFMTAIMVSTLIGLVALVLRRSTSNFYVAWGRSLMYSAPTIVLTVKDMFGSADLFCTSWALLNFELFYDWSE